ncbi:MAG: cysteine desulfurase [Gemmatimonadetes bacterium]|nr:cysteine desulfurase [Gemmatimonadota bacterium]
MPQPPIYLDHAATTPVRPEVLDAMRPYFDAKFGNASSVHRWGREARAATDEARERIAACLGAQPDEICLTSGGTEADNLAVLGGWRVQQGNGRPGLVSTPIEHKAVLESVHQAAREGADERLLRIDRAGTVNLDSARELIRADVAMVSVMWVNNETGVIQPVEALGALARDAGATFHTDAVQAFGKLAVDVRTLPVDYLSVSGHKFGAPKSIGAVFVRRGTPIAPLFFGGSQDRGRRPGTENTAYAVALATAMELAVREREVEVARLHALRDRLESALVAQVPELVVHGREAPRVPHLLHFSVPGTDSESMLVSFDLKGVAVSSGSACQSGSVTPSHVLSAMGLPKELGSAAIRMSLGKLTTDEHVDRVAALLPDVVRAARQMAGTFA